jgi:hypothetical protein
VAHVLRREYSKLHLRLRHVGAKSLPAHRQAIFSRRYPRRARAAMSAIVTGNPRSRWIDFWPFRRIFDLQVVSFPSSVWLRS